jgi:phage tail sheath protein FI
VTGNIVATDALTGHTSAGTGTASTATHVTVTDALAGGVDGNDTIADGDIITGYDSFQNSEDVDISLVLTGDASPTLALYVINNIAENRKDCVAFVSPPKDAVVANAGNELTDVLAHRNALVSTSYGFMDCNWKYQYDKYNDVNRWLPLNGDIGGLAVRTDEQRDPWFSFAGLNRGFIKNCIKLAWNPRKSYRDEMYKVGVNAVVNFQGQGAVLYGDKTMQIKPSAFDHVNVRRLFIVLEKAISTAAKYILFEFNDEFTRAQFRSMVEPFLRDVVGRRGIQDYKVVCDTTNNTGQVIDTNSFRGDIYIKPAYSINYIQLNFIATRTGTDFNEIVGKF